MCKTNKVGPKGAKGKGKKAKSLRAAIMPLEIMKPGLTLFSPT
jgi:hypothetical protein